MAALPCACRQAACSSSHKAARVQARRPPVRALQLHARAATLVAAALAGNNPTGAVARRGSTACGRCLASRTARGGGDVHRGTRPRRRRRPRGCPTLGATPPVGVPLAGEGSDPALRHIAHCRQGGGGGDSGNSRGG
ncbi:hypothetical protein C4D60_Mb01t31110 [Musa balbisiana]|uniref:Uncharacterized protein n=1 Tax=Musa balbisiana TaxID=52838 RepID=A0A4S8JS09_MUSBA|nr:hypothetical protein C4D60_Mb01t31110 [Musa balbisiana]